jgi:hypothetical protein
LQAKIRAPILSPPPIGGSQGGLEQGMAVIRQKIKNTKNSRDRAHGQETCDKTQIKKKITIKSGILSHTYLFGGQFLFLRACGISSARKQTGRMKNPSQRYEMQKNTIY